MADPPARIGIVANSDKPGASTAVPAVEAAFAAVGMATRLDEEAAGVAGRPEEGCATSEILDWCEMVVSLGGDGTLLGVANRMDGGPKPIIAVNIGTLGFLTCGTVEDIDPIARMVAGGSFVISSRAMLSVELVRGEGDAERVDGPYFGLNECTLGRGRESRMVKLRTSIDGDFLTDYNADGLIVATPTGSTAYSLSAGGPIIAPEGRVLVLTPICPHALSNRSLVFADSAVIEIKPVDHEDEVLMNIDGRISLHVEPGARVRVRRAPVVLPLVLPPDRTFYETLRQKLRWHGGNV